MCVMMQAARQNESFMVPVAAFKLLTASKKQKQSMCMNLA